MGDSFGLHVIPGIVRRVWCDTCLATSAVAVHIYVFGKTLTPPLVGTFQACPTCQPDEFEGGGDDGDRCDA